MPARPRPLLIATRNAHKTSEFRALLGPDRDVADLTTVDGPSPVEDGATFAENAAIKAVAASRLAPPGTLAVADDSGLEVDALDGRPGVHSARYAGESATDADNRARLLAELRDVPDARRTARFRCALALARDGVVVATVHGAVEGRILRTERGTGGFGYDALFVPDGFDRSFAELEPSAKNALSHRARAVRELLPALTREDSGSAPLPA